MHETMWLVVDDKTYLITGCTICCAKCQFPPFLPFSSITMPRYWKMLSVEKTPTNSTFPLFHMKIRYLSHDYASKSYSTIVEWIFSNCINRTNTVNTRVRVTYYMIFGKPYLHTIYTPFTPTSKSHLFNYPYYTNYYPI